MNAVAPLLSQLAQAPSRDALLALESHMRAFEPLECPLKHTFAPGSYAREIFMPSGALVVGKIHKHAHLNIVSRGRATVVTEFGRVEIDATEIPVTFTSEPGTKRAVYCHTDVIWTTVHLTDKTDIAQIERDIIAPGFEELDAFMAQHCAPLLLDMRRLP